MCRVIWRKIFVINEIIKHIVMKNTRNLLLEGMERLGLIASRIRQNQGAAPKIEIDIILEELRNLYMVALQLEAEELKPKIVDPDLNAAEVKRLAEEAAARKAAEEKRQAEEAAARKAAEEKRQAEEAAAKKAVEEKRQAEEAAARKAAEEKRQAEEAAARKAAEEKRQAEEAAARKAAEEKRQAEEAAARKAAEEKRQAEEAAAKKAAEEKRKAEEAAARKLAEEKRKAEEAAAKKAAEEKRKAEEAAANDEEFRPIFAPPTAAEEEAPIAEPVMESLEGNPNDDLFTEESQKPAAAAGSKKRESSLFDYLNQDNGENKPKRTLADTLNQGGRTVEDQLETRVKSKKVDDLRTIININDKFSFMSELFHNNMKAYNDFILRLNAFTDREEALAYVDEVAAQYMWNNNSLVVKNFYKVFDHKF